MGASPLFGLLALGVAGLAAAASSLYPRWVTRRVLKRMRSCARIDISAYPSGAIRRVVGVVHARGELLEAPLTGRRCVAYEVVVWDGSLRCADERKAVPFVLDDRTGRAVVYPEPLALALALPMAVELAESDPRRRLLLERLAVDLNKRDGTTREVRCVEAALEPGWWAAVLGRGVASVDPSGAPPTEHIGGFRAPAEASMVTIAGSVRVPVCVSDDASVLSDAPR
ncbi:MAG: hypothetical protein R3A79_15340 [Nannocystaceae bacterium]